MINTSSTITGLVVFTAVCYLASLVIILVACACCCRKAKPAVVQPEKGFMGSNTVPPISDGETEEVDENKKTSETATSSSKELMQEVKETNVQPAAVIEKKEDTDKQLCVQKKTADRNGSQRSNTKAEDSVIHGRKSPFRIYKQGDMQAMLAEIERPSRMAKQTAVTATSLEPPPGEPSRKATSPASFVRYLNAAYDKEGGLRSKSAATAHPTRSERTVPSKGADKKKSTRNGGEIIPGRSRKTKRDSIMSMNTASRVSKTITISKGSKK